MQGVLKKPEAGTFFFQLQSMPGVAGEMVGAVVLNNSDVSYSVVPGNQGKPELRETHTDKVICRHYIAQPEQVEKPQEIPADHPTDPNIPAYQNGIVPLSSLPGATGVIYLDFDGEEGPHESWGNFDAEPARTGNVNVRDVWERVAEDYAPFNLNVTTDLQVYLDAPQNSRIRCIITPTTTASPGSGGVAYLGSYNWTGDVPCWVFSVYWKTCVEAVSHEVGHALGLSHDGRTSPVEGYYTGHGSGDVGWAPIMGLDYYQNLSQWSKGEYLNADNTQDDLAIISKNNNNVDYRADDYGSTLATAGLLEIFGDDSVDSAGLIETRSDQDALKFTLTASGVVSLTVSPGATGPNLDILAEIVNASGGVVASDNPDASPDATVAATLTAGEYFLRVSGVGRGSATGDGYTDYGSLGFYTVSGSVPNSIRPDRFELSEDSAVGTSVGTPTSNNAHGGAALTYTITSGNSSGAFAINANTGELTVADTAQLDYRTLAPNWDDFAGFELLVNISNASNPALNETVRVVITIIQVNTAPTLVAPTSTPFIEARYKDGTGGDHCAVAWQGPGISRQVIGSQFIAPELIGSLPVATDSSVTLAEDLAVGSTVTSITFTDPDAGDTHTFSITSGNEGNAFAVDSSGNITIASALNYESNGSYTLTVRVTDSADNFDTTTVTVIVTDVDESSLSGVTAWEDAVHNATPHKQKRTQPLAGNTTATIDMSAMKTGGVSYEFIVEAEDLGQTTTALLGDSTWGLNLEAWDDTGVMGIVRYNVLDHAATPVSGKSVASPYGRKVHLFFAVDVVTNVTRIYLNGIHVGNVEPRPLINSTTATLGSNDLRNDSSPGIHAFASYNATFSHQEIMTHYRAWFGASSPVDADADNLDDGWELTHYGNLTSVTSSDDSNGNGYTAFEEMVFGIDPASSTFTAPPQQGEVIDDGGIDKFEFRFRRPQNHAGFNVSYQLQTGSDLVDANWSNDNTPPAAINSDGDNEWMIYRLALPAVSETRKFYRCRVTPQ